MNVPLTDAEFATVLADESKRIQGDVIWREDEDRSPAVEFRVDIESTNGWPLFVKGRYSVAARTLTYTLILKTAGRIYGLDLGKDHYNPQCEQVGEKHKHRWSERYGSGGVWTEFCAEARILHDGRMKPPPPAQGELW